MYTCTVMNQEAEVRIPVQVRIFLLKSETVISQGPNYRFVSTYQFDINDIFSEFQEMARSVQINLAMHGGGLEIEGISFHLVTETN